MQCSFNIPAIRVDARLSPSQPFFLQVIRGKSSSGILKQTKPASKSEVAKGPKRAIQSRKRTTTKDFVKVYADAYLMATLIRGKRLIYNSHSTCICCVLFLSYFVSQV